MSLLVGGAVLLAVGAAVALVLGWSSNDPAMAWASVTASALAAALLAAAARSARREDGDGPDA
jgi:membrane protein implicated in regulation of membrane protease activity